MTLPELMQLASDAYPEDSVMRTYLAGRNQGDTLAYCIASNIQGTFEPQASDREQLGTALAVLRSVNEELVCVIDALQERADTWEEG